MSEHVERRAPALLRRVDQACNRFESAWKAGERPRIEDCLADVPGPEQPAVLRELLALDLTYRRTDRDAALLHEYRQRFPNHGPLVQEVFQAVLSALPEPIPIPPPAPNGPGLSEATTLPPTAGVTVSSEEALPTVHGYELLSVLGRGGMGVVYKAQHVRLKRLVALKMIKAGVDAEPHELERFRQEAEAVARMQHPNVVQIHEVGEVDGRPFFALELVEGGTLDDKLDGTPWPAQRAAQLVETLARAVHAAHERGIVHRDLKPGNVLLTADGTPKVTDFGLAKRLDVDVRQTQSGAIVGTPSYMAPEQAGGKSKEVGPVADVYALGAILYELLTGRPPFKAETAMDTILQVLSDDPVPVRRLQAKVPRDLETICLKCLQKEPKKRYFSADALFQDLQKFKVGLPIASRPVGIFERTCKWVKRRPSLTALLIIVVLTLISATAGSVKYYADLKTAFAEANKQLDLARNNLMTAQLARVDTIWERDPARALELLEDTKYCPFDLRDFAWGLHYQRCSPDSSRVRSKHLKLECYGARISPDGKMLVVSATKQTELWNVVTQTRVAVLKGDPIAFSHDSKVIAVKSNESIHILDTATGVEQSTYKTNDWFEHSEFSPDSRILACWSSSDRTRNQVQLWNVNTGEKQATLPGHTMGVRAVAFAPNGRILATVDMTGIVKLWDVDTGRERVTLNGQTGVVDKDRYLFVQRLMFLPDSKILITAAYQHIDDNRKPMENPVHQIRLWDVASGKERTIIADAGGYPTLSPTGRLLALADRQGELRLWDVIAGQVKEILTGHVREVVAVAFSPDERTLASVDGEGTIRIWDVATAAERATIREPGSPINSLMFTTDGIALTAVRFSGADRGPRYVEVKSWSSDTRDIRGTLRGASGVGAFSPNGRLFAAPNRFGQVKLWDVATGAERATFARRGGFFSSVMFAPDGKTLVSIGATESILWDISTGQERLVLPGSGRGVFSLYGYAFSPDGKTLATRSDEQGVLNLWNVSSGKVRTSLRRRARWFTCVAFSPNGRILATTDGHDWTAATNDIVLWDTNKGEIQTTLAGRHFGIVPLVFAPNGLILASGDSTGTIRLWDVSNGRERFTLDGPGTVRLWDGANRRERSTLPEHRTAIISLVFSADGQTLASLSSIRGEETEKTHQIKLWDLATGQERASLRVKEGHSIAFAPNDQILAFGEASGVVRLYDVHGKELVSLKQQGWVSSVTFSPDGRILAVIAEDRLKFLDMNVIKRTQIDRIDRGQL